MREHLLISRLLGWLPLLVLPACAFVLTPETWPAWGFMWAMAVALFAGSKWLTWQAAAAWHAPVWQHLGYLFAWPGLDAAAFLAPPNPARMCFPPHALLFALGKFLFGIFLIAGVFPRCAAAPDLVRGWIGMAGIIFTLHFGLFDVLRLFWQRRGVDAKPIQNCPVCSRSVSEFWGQRWNTAFRDITHRLLFRPMTARLGGRAAIAIGFLCSGLVHELVISVPARGGYGGPTVFFLIQAAALFAERSRFGRRIGLAHGVRGWAFTMLCLLAPVVLLFHLPFLRTVIIPFMDWINGE